MISLIKIEFLKLKRRDKRLAIIITCLAVSMLLIPAVRSKRIDNWVQVIQFNSHSINFVTNIFLCVLLSELFITEYKDKTINVMFSYPISRTKIYIAKMVVVFSYCYFIVIINTISSIGVLLALNSIKPFIKDSINLSVIIKGVNITLIGIIISTLFTVIYSFFAIVKRSFLLMIIFSTIMHSIKGILQTSYPMLYLRLPLILLGISLLTVIPIVYTLNNRDVICSEGK